MVVSLKPLKPLRQCWRLTRRHAPHMNFLTFHFLYFCGTCLLGAIVIWGSATPKDSISFTDSLFMTVSAMTEAGLNTVNLSSLNTFQQVVLLLLILSGSAILVSAVMVQVRKSAFERKFQAIVEQKRERQGSSQSTLVESGLAQAKFEEMGEKSADDRSDREAADTPYVSEKDLGSCASIVSILTSDPAETPPSSTRSSRLHDPSDTSPTPSIDPCMPQALHFPGSSHRKVHDFSAATTPSWSSIGPEQTDTVRSTPRRGLPTSPSSLREIQRRASSVAGMITPISNPSGLNGRERERLGGSEYRAVCLLSWLVPVYFVVWQLLGALGCGVWIARHRPDVALQDGLEPWWVGVFSAISAFNNSGMDLLDENMVPFQDAYYLLITMSLLILAGNTCYPVFLRLIVWCTLKLGEWFPSTSPLREERLDTLRFLLKHPRRCYTLMFPAKHTWWLLTSVLMLNGIDWIAFGVLSIGNKSLANVSAGDKIIDGLFQAFAIRSGGFAIVDISGLRVALQFLYVIMMYISVYPLLVSLRTSNVYKERSVGIYATKSRSTAEQASHSKAHDSRANEPRKFLDHLPAYTAASKNDTSYDRVRQRLRDQLAHDAWWMAVALFGILLIEECQFEKAPSVFSVFNFIFEIVSAYGCVGVSVGVPWANYSFSGTWHTGSKLILCAVMLRGRHRGLPVAIDRAVQLPGEGSWNEDVDRLSGRGEERPNAVPA